MSVLEGLESKKILILGLGREGTSLLSFLRARFPDKVLGVADARPLEKLDAPLRETLLADASLELFLGPQYLQSVEQYEVIFKSPGISHRIPELAAAERAGKRFSSNTELFFELCPKERIVGVTGTKGKSTTTSLVYEVLKAGGINARLTGNIGIPPLSSLSGAAPDTTFVAELSCHQLMGLRLSPHVAVLLNIVPEHLDYYGTFDAYVCAKRPLADYQTAEDYLVTNLTHPIPRQIAEASRAQIRAFDFEAGENTQCFVRDGCICVRAEGRDEVVIPLQRIPLQGTFNVENVMAAITVGKIYGIPNETIARAIEGFRPLAHRLELVATFEGVAFYNDSLATVPEATISAMQAFAGQNLILLAGGTDRGQDFAELAQAILESSIKGMVLFPPTGERIWAALMSHANGREELPQHAFATNMKEAMQQAWAWAEAGDIVLLSPASASHGIFRDYADRGEQFIAEAQGLAVASTK